MRPWLLLLTVTACQALPGGWKRTHEQPRGPKVTVYVSHPGSTAPENEARIAEPLADQLRTLPNLERCSTRPGPGFVAVNIAFTDDLDADQAKARARGLIEAFRPDLPGSIHRIFIWSDAGGPKVDNPPASWAHMPPSQFEASISSMSNCRWSSAALGALAEGLGTPGGTSLRAAVLLAYDPGPDATDILLSRLEERAVAKERGLDAGDLVAAAALDGRGTEQSLLPLVLGTSPHPDLEVRVECARTALRAGREEVVPFLLTVLRGLTPAEREHPADWERITTLMWAKSRAAEALSDRLGITCQFRPDGAWEEQMAEADRLEDLYGR